ncbi:MAG: DUF2452 domain-containing protein [Bacteroidia bacterium]|nr:DUF2452 domain-containing protein [Bacteroidia bacterium]NNF31308.1 DUF2452 domain-containing protein [Flavobacteriaceae bacterium]MBT8274600.1 DUF2452 domain-containing protein [Bacteroidia bacterium]NNJ82138.1 DUF2452 domain-containing protein [Flavobacteriaceae bacterium]NNK54230.1 DUF2452 domain-containing protein [Flavobacteriaceae bacterium]
MPEKKPDQVVFNEETQTYDASLKPYPTNLGAPAIALVETVAWKRLNAKRANEHLKSSFEEIKYKYEKLVEKMELNELVYNAKFSFEPIVGNIYHLYRNKSEIPFLSILSPEECHFDHLGSFRLTSEKLWEAIED